MATIAALARRGVDVTAVVPLRRGDTSPTPAALRDYYHLRGDFSVEACPTPLAGVMPWRKLVHACRASRARAVSTADVVYTRNAGTFVSLAHRGLPVIYDTHRAWPDHVPLLRPFFRRAMRRSNFLGAVFHSDYARRSYARLIGDSARLIVARNGFDPERYRRERSRDEARALLKLPIDRAIAVYTGHITKFKGIQMLLAMAARRPDVLFVLVGSRGSAIDRQARAQPNVMLVDWQPYDRTVLYQWAADVLLSPPSRTPLTLAGHTILPLKVYGYLAAGRAILAGGTPDVTEVLEHDRNAWLVEPGNVADAVGGLRRLLSDERLRSRLGEEAKKASANLTWDARAAIIEAFIRARLVNGFRE